MRTEMDHSVESIGHNCSLTAVVLEKPSRIIYSSLVYGIEAQNHRGGEGAGVAIATSDGLQIVKGLGLYSQAVPDSSLTKLPAARSVIGHTRYSVTGGSSLGNVQPYKFKDFAIAHNGNITKLPLVSTQPEEPTSDTFRVGRAIEAKEGDFEEKTPSVLAELNGSYVFFLLTNEGQVYIATDPWGNRPCLLGKINNDGNGFVAVSESVALPKIRADFIGTVPRGVFGRLEHSGLTVLWKDPRIKEFPRASCSFEQAYFADASSMASPDVHGLITNHSIRVKLGERVAFVAKPRGEKVVAVPESGRSYAQGVAQKTGLPISLAIQANRFKGRNFLQPHTPEERVEAAFQKFNFIREEIAGEELIIVDDSIVRGYTQQGIVLALFRLGARSIEILSGIPPIVAQCHWGIDFQREEELIYHNLMTNKGISEFEDCLAGWLVNGDENLRARLRISFQRVSDYVEITAGVPRNTEIASSGFCYHCVTGIVPQGLDLVEEASKERFEVLE